MKTHKDIECDKIDCMISIESIQCRLHLDHPASKLDGLDFDTPIYRYFDLPGFSDLVQNSRLRFTKASALRFDCREGEYTPSELNKIHEVPEVGNHNHQIVSDFSEHFRNSTYISCWSLNSPSDRYMWDIFTSDREGIAVETTLNRLRSCIFRAAQGDGSENYETYVSVVSYFDESQPLEPPLNLLSPFCRKPLNFSEEAEIRFFLNTMPTIPNDDYLYVRTESLIDLPTSIFLPGEHLAKLKPIVPIHFQSLIQLVI